MVKLFRLMQHKREFPDDIPSRDALSQVLHRIAHVVRKRGTPANQRYDCCNRAYRDAFDCFNVGHYTKLPQARKEQLLGFLSYKASNSCSQVKPFYRDLSRLICGSNKLAEIEKGAVMTEHEKWPVSEIDVRPSASAILREFEIDQLSCLKWTHALLKSEPFVVRHMCSAWSGVALWSHPSYWKSILSQYYVPVEIGVYRNVDFDVAVVSFDEYVDYLRSSPDQNYLYLAQFDIFSHFPWLEDDVLPVSDFFLLAGNIKARSFFMGPARSFTPLHTDPWPNFLAQIVGQKYVRLYSPSDIPEVRDGASAWSYFINNDVTVPIEASCRYPEANAYLDVTLHPGDVLYIPKGCWHFVKNTETSISVSHFID